MEGDWYIVEVEGEGCYCLCYDDKDGNRVLRIVTGKQVSLS